MDMPLDSTADPFTEAGFRERARRGLLAEPSAAIFDPRTGRALGPSDWDLDPQFMGDLAVMEPPRPAAVLVPIVLREQLTVMLTERSHDMPSHPGQISFPGGKVEESDVNPEACALREAREEIGVTADFIEPLGYLDSYRTGTGFQISPVVALVRPGFTPEGRFARGARGVRGPARISDECGQPQEAVARVAGPRALVLRHAL